MRSASTGLCASARTAPPDARKKGNASRRSRRDREAAFRRPSAHCRAKEATIHVLGFVELRLALPGSPVQFVLKNIGRREDFEIADLDGDPEFLAKHRSDIPAGINIEDAGLLFERTFYIGRNFNQNGAHGISPYSVRISLI